jgi:hypothetical protein
MAARTLAMEFAKLWAGDDDCALPQRVTSVSRQGVSYTILDNQEFIQELRTGIYVIDLFLKTVNPDNARKKAKVFTPDVPRARRYTAKPLALTANASFDLVGVKGANAVWNSTGVANVSVLFANTGYTPQVKINNYGSTKSVTIDSTNISLNNAASTMTFTATYEDTFNAIGMVDPGTWTLYATRTVNNVAEVSQLATGNISTRMYS